MNWSIKRNQSNLLPRRGMIMVFGLPLVILVAGFSSAVDSLEDRYGSWYFTAEEVAAAYQYQQNYGQRMRGPLPATACLFREGSFLASYQGQKFRVPCRFIDETTRHLREMLSVGAAKYLFALDADHAHLGVPIEDWKRKYQHLSPNEIFPAILLDPGLVALYHTAEHLRITDRKTGAVNVRAQAWQEKRNVLGFFDGRPIQVLIPHESAQGVSMPEGYYSYSGFTFLASPRGELFLSVNENFVSFDIALDGASDPESGGERVSTSDQRGVVRNAY